MKINLAYGKSGLALDLPDSWDVTVVESSFIEAVPDPLAAIRQALHSPIGSQPLADLIHPDQRIGIVFSDLTRPTPNDILIPTILAELKEIPPENITLFNALGTHRTNSDTELRGLLGDEIVDRFRIVQNNAFNPQTQVHLGCTKRGHEIYLNREFFDCDLKILTGLIEPHFFAGFSGGGKAVMPGMAGQITVLGNHDAGMIADPHSKWGVTYGNPIWEEIQEVARKAGPSFLVNVTLNKNKQITCVFAGDLQEAYAAGCKFVRETVVVEVNCPFDIVITSNSGYPLDLNLYQAVKGMSAAAQIVRPGGAILVAAECWDGIPEHGLYRRLLRNASSPQALLETIGSPGFLEQDQWQAQIQAQIQLKAQVYLYSGHLTNEQIRSALLLPAHDILTTIETVMAEMGGTPCICILPEGPQTIPFVKLPTQ